MLNGDKPITNNNSISESDFVELTREDIQDILKLWASKDQLLKFQETLPNEEAASELFGLWIDSYVAEFKIISEVFSFEEVEFLNNSDK